MPFTVFVTAYDQHAIRAFEANALDYLQKPFSDERLEATMARVKGRPMNAARGNSDSAFFARRRPRHQPIAV